MVGLVHLVKHVTKTIYRRVPLQVFTNFCRHLVRHDTHSLLACASMNELKMRRCENNYEKKLMEEKQFSSEALTQFLAKFLVKN